MDINDIRCIMEGVILPALAWLARVFAPKKKDAAAARQEAAGSPPLSAGVLQPPQIDMAPQVRQLQQAGDLYGLLSMLHTDPDPALRLDAADALAQVGNEEGLDYLIEKLASQDPAEQDAAREIIQALNDPRGNAALQGQPVAVRAVAAAGSSAQQEPPRGTVVGNDAWAAYRDKQASIEAERLSVAPHTATTDIGPHVATGAASAAQAKRPRWLRDFLPGALGALLITLASAAYLYFATPANASEEEQGLLLSQVICLPVTLVMGALFGAAGALLTKRILLALHAGERALAVTTTIGSFLSGALTGCLCDFLFMMSAAL